jgi:hypothetical protein
MALPNPGAKLNVSADWQPKASELVKAQAKHLDEGKSLSSMPTKAPSERSTKGVPAKKMGEGGRRKSRRHSKKTKRTRRHSRKH